MRGSIRLSTLSLVALAVLFAPRAATAQFGNLVNRIPADANAMLLIDEDKLLASPLAQKEGWRSKLEDAFSGGLVILPPQASRFLLSARLDFEQMRPIWEAAVLDLKYEASAPKAAVRYGGQVDEISGLEAVQMPGGGYVIKFGPQLIGVLSPANRQTATQWVNQVHANDTGVLSPYMQQAVKFAETSAGIILALDLEHVVAPAVVRERLETSEVLKGRNVDLDQVAGVLASVRGMMLGITVSDQRNAAIRVDFTQDASPLKDFAKELLLETLGNHGLMIDEFQEWTARTVGNQIQLSGVLYQSGMRRVLSILDAPPAAQRPMTSHAEGEGSSDEQLVIMSSQMYFKSITSLLDDLRLKRSSSEFVSWGQVGAWFEKYARKIDGMPILNVDPQLLDYGAYVADSLREAESAMKGIGARSGLRKTEVPNYYNTYARGGVVGVPGYGAVGGYRWRTTEDLAAKGQEEARIRTQERIRGNTSANLIVQGITDSTADVRRLMTEKYKVEF